MANEMASGAPARDSSSNRNKLIILGVLLLVLLLVFLLMSRKSSQTSKQIAGTSFTLMTTIYDLKIPLGVALDADDNIYVSNTGGAEVRFYDPDGALKFALNEVAGENNEAINFGSPYGLAVDDGRDKLYVCESNNVRVLDKAGNFQYYLVAPAEAVVMKPGEGAPRPNEVALSGDRVFVTSRDGIYVFSAEDGKYLEHWGQRGPEVGNYDFPNGIAVDPASGNIFVVDTLNKRIVALTPEGKPRWTLGAQDGGKIPGPLDLPRSIAVGPDGRLYITDTSMSRIVVLDADGKLISIIGERGTGDAQLNFPEGLAISASNRLVFADRENNRVQVWQIADPLPTPGAADVDKFAKALRKV